MPCVYHPRPSCNDTPPRLVACRRCGNLVRPNRTCWRCGSKTLPPCNTAPTSAPGSRTSPGCWRGGVRRERRPLVRHLPDAWRARRRRDRRRAGNGAGRASPPQRCAPRLPQRGSPARGMARVQLGPEPEDRGFATLSPLGDVEYVEDLIRPGRVVVGGRRGGHRQELRRRRASWASGSRVAGGSFAGTWPVLRTGPVLVLSRDAHRRRLRRARQLTLGSLGLERPRSGAATTGSRS